MKPSLSLYMTTFLSVTFKTEEGKSSETRMVVMMSAGQLGLKSRVGALAVVGGAY